MQNEDCDEKNNETQEGTKTNEIIIIIIIKIKIGSLDSLQSLFLYTEIAFNKI